MASTATPAAEVAQPAPTPTVAEVKAEPTPTWEQCQSFARDFYKGSRRADLAIARRNAAVHATLLVLERVWRQGVVDHAETELGRKFATGSQRAQDAVAAMEKTLAETPDACHGYGDQWDALGVAAESATFEECIERVDRVEAAIPQHTLSANTERILDVLDKLAEESSEIDTVLAYEVLGELLYARHQQYQAGQKVALISRCGSTQWEKAAQELSAAMTPAP